MQVLLAVSVLLLTFVWLFYARGFERWGAIVLMIGHIVRDIRWYLFVILIVIIGFMSALTITLGPHMPKYENPLAVMSMLMIFGVYGEVDVEELSSFEVPLQNAVAAEVFFQLYMVVVALVLINMLIVIMNDATERVRSAVSLHAMSEKTQVLLEIDEVHLPILTRSSLLTWFLARLWPRLLSPVSILFRGAYSPTTAQLARDSEPDPTNFPRWYVRTYVRAGIARSDPKDIA